MIASERTIQQPFFCQDSFSAQVTVTSTSSHANDDWSLTRVMLLISPVSSSALAEKRRRSKQASAKQCLCSHDVFSVYNIFQAPHALCLAWLPGCPPRAVMLLSLQVRRYHRFLLYATSRTTKRFFAFVSTKRVRRIFSGQLFDCLEHANCLQPNVIARSVQIKLHLCWHTFLQSSLITDVFFGVFLGSPVHVRYHDSGLLGPLIFQSNTLHLSMMSDSCP